MARRVYPFNYFVARRDHNRGFKIHQRRDLGAAIELLAALRKIGYEYGQPLLNFPPEHPRRKPTDKLHKVDVSFVQAGDLILQTTRPPLDDREHGDRKQIELGYTDLEWQLFAVWRQYLEICARSHVKLGSRVRDDLPEGFENRKDMAFREGTGAPYKELNALDGSGWRKHRGRRTAAFLLRVEELWENGPGFLGAFGMDGTSTMIWAYRLSRDFSELLSEPGFVMAEMEGSTIPTRSTDLRWANDWPIEIVLHHKQ